MEANKLPDLDERNPPLTHEAAHKSHTHREIRRRLIGCQQTTSPDHSDRTITRHQRFPFIRLKTPIDNPQSLGAGQKVNQGTAPA
jgi:hypothetical protein